MSGEAVRASWSEILSTLIRREDLDFDSVAWAMGEIMNGAGSDAQIAAFLVALRAKGETPQEIAALAATMLEHAVPLQTNGPALDIVGTGGDRAFTVNISTTAAMVAAGAGIRVVKHGNRAASSASGAADVLEALGVVLALSPDAVAAVAEEVGIAFAFAQTFHPSMRHVAQVRRQLAVPTVFNVLGPLTNPAQPTYSAIGVADRVMAPLVAGALAARGRRGVVFRGEDGLDEVTTATTSGLWLVDGGQVRADELHPDEVGLASHPLEELRGGDALHNAAIVRAVLEGQRGAVFDAVVLNAGVAIGTYQHPVASHEDLVHAVRAGVDQAIKSIDTGGAAAILDQWIRTSQALAAQ